MRGQTAITVVACCWLDVGTVASSVAPASSNPQTEALQFFEAVIVGNDATGILRSLRPLPASETDRIAALASVPPESIVVPDATERTKLETLQRVLIYHERQHVIEIKMIGVPMAVVGLHQRSVILISRPVLRLLSDVELQATVAHEMGHDYFWRDDQAVRARDDMRSFQILELKCDGVAALTMLALRLEPAHLYRAIEKIARFNGVPEARWGKNGYPSPHDRQHFVADLLELLHKDDAARMNKRVIAADAPSPADRCCSDHEGIALDRLVHLGGVVPGNDARAHQGVNLQQGRPAFAKAPADRRSLAEAGLTPPCFCIRTRACLSGQSSGEGGSLPP